MSTAAINILDHSYTLRRPGPGDSYTQAKWGGQVNPDDPDFVGYPLRMEAPVGRRVTLTDRSQSDGSVASRTFLGSRITSVSIGVEGQTYDERAQRCLLLEGVLQPSRWGRTELHFEMLSGTEVYLPVIVSEVRAIGENDQFWKVYDIQMIATDPRLYAAESTDVASTETSGSVRTVTIDNEGNACAPAELFRITGPCVQPIITNTTTGDVLRWGGILDEGEFLDIRSREKSIMLNGTTSRYGALDIDASVSFEDFTFEPGENVYELTALFGLDTDTMLEVTYRSAWSS